MTRAVAPDPMTRRAGPPAPARRGHHRIAVAVTVAALAAGGLAACSNGGDDAQPPLTTPTTRDPRQPASRGETCTDPVGDLSDDARTTAAGTLSEPAGIDLVEAATKVDGDALIVDITTNGTIANALNPEFFIDSGDPQQAPATSWELRIAPTGGTWTATLVTFPTTLGARDTRTPLTAPVSVRGNRLSATVPLADLPPIATTLWLFGASAGASDATRIFDECLPFTSSSGTTTGTRPPGGSSTAAPPTTLAAGTVGQPVTAPDGTRVTVRTVDVPARPNRVPEEEPVPGSQLAAVEAEVCAGSATLQGVGEQRFTLRTSAGTGSAPWAAPAYTNDPRFPAGQTLRPGECAAGWITFQIAADATAAQVLYDTSGTGAGPFLTIDVG